MAKLTGWTHFVAIAILIGACSPAEQSDDSGFLARLHKQWPAPPPAENDGDRFWRLGNGYLSLKEPDPLAPPQVGVRSVLDLSCDDLERLVVGTDIVVAQDVPLPYPPFDVLSIEGGGVRLHTPIRNEGNGYTSYASGDFTASRTDLEQLLAAPFIVIRPLHIGQPEMEASSVDIGERYGAPPEKLRLEFLEGCPGE